jgi:hypothetical protein
MAVWEKQVMDSVTAKTALLQYCRFARQYHYVATEVSIGEGLADVLASDGKNLIEYEIKVSISDLLKDKEKPKHILYDPAPIVWDGNIGTKGKIRIELRQGERKWEPDKWSAVAIDGDREYGITGYYVKNTIEEARQDAEKEYGTSKKSPNTLYYVIPDLLWSKYEEKILASLHASYGVITFASSNYHSMTVRRKAKKLHKNDVSQGMLTTIVARMGSELATLTNMFYSQIREFTEYGKRIEEKFELEDLDEN